MKKRLRKEGNMLGLPTGPCHYPGKYTINVYTLYIDSIFTWIVTRPCGLPINNNQALP